jgi:superkiller protein 3
VDEAIAQYQAALQIKPDYTEAQFNLGNALGQIGRLDEAIAHYQAALQIRPDYADAQFNLGNVLMQKGEVDDAITHFQSALEINPNNATIHLNLGLCFYEKGLMEEAIAQYQTALQLQPADPKVQNNLAWILATCPQASLRNGNKAVELALQANELSGGDNPIILHTLAAAFAEAGRFPEAVQTAQRSLVLAEAQSRTVLAGQLHSELKLFQSGSPFHSP